MYTNTVDYFFPDTTVTIQKKKRVCAELSLVLNIISRLICLRTEMVWTLSVSTSAMVSASKEQSPGANAHVKHVFFLKLMAWNIYQYLKMIIKGEFCNTGANINMFMTGEFVSVKQRLSSYVQFSCCNWTEHEFSHTELLSHA